MKCAQKPAELALSAALTNIFNARDLRIHAGESHSAARSLKRQSDNNNNNNKKYVLWNAGICPIAPKVGHVTLATLPLGSFIVPYVVSYLPWPIQQRKNEESSFIR